MSARPFFVALLLLAASLPLSAAAQVYMCAGDTGETRLSQTQDAGCELYLKSGDEGALKGVRARIRLPWAEEEARRKQAEERERQEAQLAALPFHSLVRTAATEFRVDAALVHAVIAAESGYDPLAISDKGAVGLMQLMPDTALRYGVKQKDLRIPARNIHAGTKYLADLLELFGGDVELALAGYNAGEGAVVRFGRKVPPFAETRAYVPRVLDNWRKLRSITL